MNVKNYCINCVVADAQDSSYPLNLSLFVTMHTISHNNITGLCKGSLANFNEESSVMSDWLYIDE